MNLGRGLFEFPRPQFVKSYKRLNREPPKRLAHYTNGSALINICQKKELWAGRTVQMNDYAEQTILVEHIERLCSQELDRKEIGSIRLDFCRALLDADFDSVPNRLIGLSTISLTENHDQLSQWRAYCKRSGGYSIRLPSALLEGLAHEQNFILAPCLYEVEEARELAQEVLDVHCRFYEKIRSTVSHDEAWSRTSGSLGRDLLIYGIFVKHHTFREEAEWRLASLPVAKPDYDLVFVESENGVKAFSPFFLDTAANPISKYADICEVWIGPNLNMEAAVYPAQVLLRRMTGNAEGVYRTTTTYR